jgi:eukaryotic-like serine/threonine-protein kinase
MSLTLGSRIGPYEIVVPLGVGAMGEVYRARDTRLARMVAIKILTSADPSRIARLEREARAISRVSHSHICALHDIGRQDSLAYLVMEYLEGETLAQRLERGALRLDHALSIAIQICEALDAAHTAGVIHRDLKPSNVMLTSAGVKLLDFGLAKLRELEQDPHRPASTQSGLLTEDGAVLGTYPYMAPEQVAGGSVDGRADIFALGVVIYEMVSGTRPFDAPTRAGLAAAILTHEPPGLSTVCSGVPLALDRVVERCLVKDPEARWQTARDLASELLWIAEDLEDRGRDTTPIRRDHPHRQRRLVWAGIGSVAGLIAGALAVWGLSALGLIGGNTPIPRFTQVTFRSGTVLSARFAPDGETIIYSAAWNGQPYQLFMSRMDSAESRPLGVTDAKLLGVSTAGELAFLRGSHSSLRYFVASGGTLARVSLAGGGPRDVLDDVVSADWIPGTDQLVVARTDGQVEFPIGTKFYKPAVGGIRALRVAPGGDRLALIQLGPARVDVIVLDRSGRTIASSTWTNAGNLAWSPNGREVWFSATREYVSHVVWAMSMAGETRVLVPTEPEMRVVQDVSRDGRILLASHTRRVGFCCVQPGATAPRELAWFDFSMPEALSADGTTVVFGDRPAGPPGTAYLRKTDGSDAIRLGDGYPEDLSPDGSFVLVGVRVGAAHFAILPTGSGPSRSLPPGPIERIGEANFLPDGRHIVFGAGERGRLSRIYVQRLDDGSLPRPISPEGIWTNALPTPDGRFVWGTSPNSGHVLYPIEEGSARPLPFLSTGDVPLQWSPDGRYLYLRRDSWPPEVDRIDTANGIRGAWKTIFPADPVGIDNVVRILITPDGMSYCYDYARLLTNLFVVDEFR